MKLILLFAPLKVLQQHTDETFALKNHYFENKKGNPKTAFSIFYEKFYFESKQIFVSSLEYYNFYKFFNFAFKNNLNILVESPILFEIEINNEKKE